MRKYNKVLIIAIVLMFVSVATVNAADATANLRASSTSLKKGDTFTVTLSAEYADGINGIEGLFSYDEDKLELVTKVVEGETISVESASSKWINLGVGLKFEVMYGLPSGTATSGDIVKATFKVKDDAEEGTTAKVTVSDIVLHTFEQTNSEKEIGTKEVEINIIENNTGDDNEPGTGDNNKPGTDDSNKPGTDDSNKPGTDDNNKPGTNNNSKPGTDDKTTSKNEIPKTGSYSMIGIIIIAIITSTIFLTKYKKYKNI